MQILKEENPDWSPRIWLTDYSEAEMLAIVSKFPSTKIYLCDFHREQCWQRWMKDRKHDLAPADGEILLNLLRKAAFAPPTSTGGKEFYFEAIKQLKRSEIWKLNPKVRDWLEGRWLCIPEVRKKDLPK